MEFILSWLDKSSMTYKNKIFEADTDKKAINIAKKHFESMSSGSWDKPFLSESNNEQLKMWEGRIHMSTRNKEKYEKACNYCIENRDYPQKEKISHIINEYNYSDSTARAIIRDCRTKEEQEYYKNKYGRKKKDSKEKKEPGKKSLREKLAIMQKYEEKIYTPKGERKPREKFKFDDSRL